ncbi:MAG: PD-(D/E)XK nuclease family protein [Clostridia bacterium]|nr:PD-(D/E)XK nuclease family protein [Clostridia bacterium]
MQARDLKDMFFSQLALKTYQSCPLRFRRRYLEGLFWPGNWAGDKKQREAIEGGRLFHLLAQRYYTQGEVPAGQLVPEPVAAWLGNLVSFRPFNGENRFYPEHELRLNDRGIRLLAKYDLLMVTPDGRAVIYDWKTNGSRPTAAFWRKDFQTRVYLYLLCRAGGAYSPKGGFTPEDISMVYWNPNHPGAIEPLAYSEKQLLADEKLFRETIEKLEGLDFEDFGPTPDQRQCRFCEYAPICHGERAMELEMVEEDLDIDLDWESIGEIAF